MADNMNLPLSSAEVLMEELYQNLRRDAASPDWIIRHSSGTIRQEVYQRLHEAGKLAQHYFQRMVCDLLNLQWPVYDAFLMGEEKDYQLVRDTITGYLKHTGSVPHDKSTNSRDLAVKWLVRNLTEELLEQFNKQLAAHDNDQPSPYVLKYVTWSRFLEGQFAPARTTMGAIRLFLHLTDDEYTKLYRLARKEYLYEPERVHEDVNRYWGLWQKRMKRERSVQENWEARDTFCQESAVSRTAFNLLLPDLKSSSKPAEEADASPAKTTQSTMLKLCAAFHLPPYKTEGFLSRLDSGFYDMRDLLFCSCFYLKIYDPARIHSILEFYANSPGSSARPRFDNPYKPFAKDFITDKKK